MNWTLAWFVPVALAQPTNPAAPAPATAAALPATTAAPNAVELYETSPTGLTADRAAERAAATSFVAQAQAENLRAAAARLDAAWAGFLPRLNAVARYTRLSPLTNPSLTGDGSLVVTTAPANTPNPSPTFAAGGFSFPIFLDNYLLQASIAVPISDYFLRLNEVYSAASHAEDGARYDWLAAKAKSASDGKIAFYTWIRARSAATVAELALKDQRTHLADAKNLFAAGTASKADVLRAETAIAAAEVTVERAKNLASLADKQLRVAMHAGDNERLVAAERIDEVPAPLTESLDVHTSEALRSRAEAKGIEANVRALEAQSRAQRNALFPQLSAFGDVQYANPNQRLIPQQDRFFATWTAGGQLTWTPNDVITGLAQGADARARAAAANAQREQLLDGIRVEVTQAYQCVRETDVSIDAASRELASATEAHRVARELFQAGRVTSTTLTDAETELTRARLDVLNARVDARIARVRLAHAVGRDLPREK